MHQHYLRSHRRDFTLESVDAQCLFLSASRRALDTCVSQVSARVPRSVKSFLTKNVTKGLHSDVFRDSLVTCVSFQSVHWSTENGTQPLEGSAQLIEPLLARSEKHVALADYLVIGLVNGVQVWRLPDSPTSVARQHRATLVERLPKDVEDPPPRARSQPHRVVAMRTGSPVVMAQLLDDLPTAKPCQGIRRIAIAISTPTTGNTTTLSSPMTLTSHARRAATTTVDVFFSSHGFHGGTRTVSECCAQLDANATGRPHYRHRHVLRQPWPVVGLASSLCWGGSEWLGTLVVATTMQIRVYDTIMFDVRFTLSNFATLRVPRAWEWLAAGVADKEIMTEKQDHNVCATLGSLGCTSTSSQGSRDRDACLLGSSASMSDVPLNPEVESLWGPVFALGTRWLVYQEGPHPHRDDEKPSAEAPCDVSDDTSSRWSSWNANTEVDQHKAPSYKLCQPTAAVHSLSTDLAACIPTVLQQKLTPAIRNALSAWLPTYARCNSPTEKSDQSFPSSTSTTEQGAIPSSLTSSLPHSSATTSTGSFPFLISSSEAWGRACQKTTALIKSMSFPRDLVRKAVGPSTCTALLPDVVGVQQDVSGSLVSSYGPKTSPSGGFLGRRLLGGRLLIVDVATGCCVGNIRVPRWESDTEEASQRRSEEIAHEKPEPDMISASQCIEATDGVWCLTHLEGTIQRQQTLKMMQHKNEDVQCSNSAAVRASGSSPIALLKFDASGSTVFCADWTGRYVWACRLWVERRALGGFFQASLSGASPPEVSPRSVSGAAIYLLARGKTVASTVDISTSNNTLGEACVTVTTSRGTCHVFALPAGFHLSRPVMPVLQCAKAGSRTPCGNDSCYTVPLLDYPASLRKLAGTTSAVKVETTQGDGNATTATEKRYFSTQQRDGCQQDKRLHSMDKEILPCTSVVGGSGGDSDDTGPDVTQLAPAAHVLPSSIVSSGVIFSGRSSKKPFVNLLKPVARLALSGSRLGITQCMTFTGPNALDTPLRHETVCTEETVSRSPWRAFFYRAPQYQWPTNSSRTSEPLVFSRPSLLRAPITTTIPRCQEVADLNPVQNESLYCWWCFPFLVASPEGVLECFNALYDDTRREERFCPIWTASDSCHRRCSSTVAPRALLGGEETHQFTFRDFTSLEFWGIRSASPSLGPVDKSFVGCGRRPEAQLIGETDLGRLQTTAPGTPVSETLLKDSTEGSPRGGVPACTVLNRAAPKPCFIDCGELNSGKFLRLIGCRRLWQMAVRELNISALAYGNPLHNINSELLSRLNYHPGTPFEADSISVGSLKTTCWSKNCEPMTSSTGRVGYRVTVLVQPAEKECTLCEWAYAGYPAWNPSKVPKKSTSLDTSALAFCGTAGCLQWTPINGVLRPSTMTSVQRDIQRALRTPVQMNIKEPSTHASRDTVDEQLTTVSTNSVNIEVPPSSFLANSIRVTESPGDDESDCYVRCCY